MVAKRLHHFRIRKFQQPRALFDQGHAHTQRGKHARVLHADDPAPDDDHRFGNLRHAQDLIAVDDGPIVERHQGRDGGFRARRENDVIRFKLRLPP